jgi:hypothetical protein
MQNTPPGHRQPAPSRAPSNVSGLRKSPRVKEERQPNPLSNANDVVATSDMGDRDLNRDDAVHTLERAENSFQSVYEAGLAKSTEAGYRRGYREGFSDGYQSGYAQAMAVAPRDTPAVELNKTGAKSVTRLRGLPCANCGRSSYTDELQCPGCGAPKVRAFADRNDLAPNQDRQIRSSRETQWEPRSD